MVWGEHLKQERAKASGPAAASQGITFEAFDPFEGVCLKCGVVVRSTEGGKHQEAHRRFHKAVDGAVALLRDRLEEAPWVGKSYEAASGHDFNIRAKPTNEQALADAVNAALGRVSQLHPSGTDGAEAVLELATAIESVVVRMCRLRADLDTPLPAVDVVRVCEKLLQDVARRLEAGSDRYGAGVVRASQDLIRGSRCATCLRLFSSTGPCTTR